MTGKMSLRTLSFVVAAVISSVLIALCSGNAADEPPRYKNHRTASSNAAESAPNVASKSAYLSATQGLQLQYADVSNAKDFETTEAAPEDVVRMFITPIGKRKPQQPNQPAVAASTAAVRVQTSTAAVPAAVVKNPASPTYYVTAVSAASAAAAAAVSKSPVYPPSRSTVAINKDASADAQLTTVAAATDDEPKRRSRYNGTSNKSSGQHAAAVQDRAHTHLLYATTQPSVATSVGRVVTSNASKPFATVIVPKKMLEAVDYARGDDSSFRPMASAPFSYKPPSLSPQQQQLTTEHGASKRHGHVHHQQQQQQQLQKTSLSSASVASYRVEEYAVTEQPPTAAFDRGLHNELVGKPVLQDRFGGATFYGPADKPAAAAATAEKSKQQHEQVKRQENVAPVYDYTNYDASYGAGSVDTFAYEKPYSQHKTVASSRDRHRDHYAQQPSAADAPPSMEQRSPYGPATAATGMYEMARSPTFEYEKSLQRPLKHKDADAKDYAESSSADEANAKDLLKYLLRDVFKLKQRGDIKSKSSGVNEFMDSYFKTDRHNEDLSLDSYDIETDMSCNLRSTKYISDGQCVTTRPIVEAVCADRCLVYAPSLSSQRQRLSSTVNQQVEALHCVDGDVKFVRVQLKCRDGNAVNNVIKVVTNCRCKLHQIQPQMRSNSPVAIHSI